MTVRTDVLLLDVRGAIDDIGLDGRGLAFNVIVEDRPETFDFTAAERSNRFSSEKDTGCNASTGVRSRRRPVRS